MRKMTLVFKGGAQITVDATEVTVARSAYSGDITKIEWKTPADWKNKLFSLDVNEVAAVVCHD